MQKKRLVVAAFISFYSMNSFAACTTPVSGDRVWDLAATALDKINTTESKLCEILFEINNDFTGTFTVAENILIKACNSLTLVQQIDSSFDQLIINLPDTISKLCVIDSKVDLLTTQVEDLQVDISGTFTALDSLKTTICSKLEQVSAELGQIEIDITLLTQTEIDHAITIASQLSVLQTDVDLLNSALDTLTIDVDVQALDSCVDVLVSLVDDLDMDVDNLQGAISNGFAGTFTALDEQLSKACIIDSLIDIAQVTPIVDFSNVFTALDALQQKVCNIESLVDILCLINSRDIICSSNSKIDIALSKICLAEQEIVPLPSLADVIISKLEAVEMAGFDVACSKIEATISILDIIGSKVDTIESKVCQIDLLNNTSKLQVIDNELITIESKLDNVDVMTSRLCVVDSKVDTLQQTALTIESIIDVINTEAQVVDSKIDTLSLISKADLLESKLCEIEPSTRLICSNLDLLLASLQTSDSKLDIMIPLAESNIDQLLTVESRIDAIDSKLDALPVTTIISKLCVIENQVCTIESVLDIIGPLIGTLNFKAQELIGDFQETWTILDVIENKLCTAEPILETITSKLDQDISLDLSGVFTEIEAILQKECTVDSKVDIALSLVDVFISKQDEIDFSGVFTALDALLMKVCTVDSQTDVLDTKVDNLVSFCGIPIRASSLPLTITTPERYFLAENIDYAGTTDAITISTDNVFLDLNGYTLNYTGVTASIDGVMISASTNVQVVNGAISNFTADGINATGGGHLVFAHLNISNTTGDGLQTGGRTVVINNVTTSNCNVLTVGTANAWIKNCSILNAPGTGIFVSSGDNTYISDCIIKQSGPNGIATTGTINNFVLQRSIVMGSGSFGIQTNIGASVSGWIILDSIFTANGNNGLNYDHDEAIIMRNTSSGNGSDGFCLTAMNSPTNNYFAFNTAVENSGMNFREGGPNPNANTYLGNFAFNSDAVGDPNNTNYTLISSNITRKFVTASQSGSFGDFPTKWHNINMLP